MDRGTVATNFLTTILAAGLAAMIAVAPMSSTSPYFHVLLYAGFGFMMFGGLGLMIAFSLSSAKSARTKGGEQKVTSHGQTGGITAHTVKVGKNDESR